MHCSLSERSPHLANLWHWVEGEHILYDNYMVIVRLCKITPTEFPRWALSSATDVAIQFKDSSSSVSSVKSPLVSTGILFLQSYLIVSGAMSTKKFHLNDLFSTFLFFYSLQCQWMLSLSETELRSTLKSAEGFGSSSMEPLVPQIQSSCCKRTTYKSLVLDQSKLQENLRFRSLTLATILSLQDGCDKLTCMSLHHSLFWCLVLLLMYQKHKNLP